jgi:hypothetical protein
MKVRQIISLIERDGWRRIEAKGGHRQYKHPLKRGVIERGERIALPMFPTFLDALQPARPLRRRKKELERRSKCT